MAFVKRCLPDFAGTGRKFAELNLDTGKRELEDVPLVEALPRYGEAEGVGASGLIEGGGVSTKD